MLLKVGKTKSTLLPPCIFVETLSSGLAVPSIQTLMALFDAVISHSMHNHLPACAGADSFQLVQSPVGPTSLPVPHRSPFPGMYCPPIGRMTPAGLPAASTNVK